MLSEPPKLLGIPSTTEQNYKKALVDCFPANPARELKHRLVEVNDKASLVEVVDRARPDLAKLQTMVNSEAGRKGFSFGYAERERGDVLHQGRLQQWNKLDQINKF